MYIVQCMYVEFSRKNRTLIIKSEQIIVRGRVRAHFKAMVILYVEKKIVSCKVITAITTVEQTKLDIASRLG